MSRLPQRIGALGFVLAASASAGPLSAQDTTKAFDNGGVRVILEYNPGVRPGIVVLIEPWLLPAASRSAFFRGSTTPTEWRTPRRSMS